MPTRSHLGAGLQHDMRGLRIIGEIGVHHRRVGSVNTRMEQGRAHDDDLAKTLCGLGRLRERKRDIREWADWAERNFARIFFRHADDEIRSVLARLADLRLRQLDFADCVGAMHMICAPHIGIDERARDAPCDRNVRTAEKLQHAQRILGGDGGVGIAEGRGQRLELYARTAERIDNRHRIVDAGIDVDDYAAGGTHGANSEAWGRSDPAIPDQPRGAKPPSSPKRFASERSTSDRTKAPLRAAHVLVSTLRCRRPDENAAKPPSVADCQRSERDDIGEDVGKLIGQALSLQPHGE